LFYSEWYISFSLSSGHRQVADW